MLAAPAEVAKALDVRSAIDLESIAAKFVIITGGLAGVMLMILGLLALLFQYRIGKQLRTQAHLARATWREPGYYRE